MSISKITKRIKMINLNSGGDTIVEVMIVLVVLSMSIGIAYSTADASIVNIRESEAHSNVNNLISGQVEELFANASEYSQNDIYSQTIPFCFSSGTITTTNCKSTYNGTTYTVYIYNCDDKSISPDTSLKTFCTGVSSDPPTLATPTLPSSPGAPAFVVNATWPPIGSGLTDSDTIVYQVPERMN